jgi:hypothetical protein
VAFSVSLQTGYCFLFVYVIRQFVIKDTASYWCFTVIKFQIVPIFMIMIDSVIWNLKAHSRSKKCPFFRVSIVTTLIQRSNCGVVNYVAGLGSGVCNTRPADLPLAPPRLRRSIACSKKRHCPRLSTAFQCSVLQHLSCTKRCAKCSLLYVKTGFNIKLSLSVIKT